jgi:predicted acyl esterase
MSKSAYANRRNSKLWYSLSDGMLPRPDGFLAYEIIPTPGGVRIEKDIMVTLPDGVRLACNVARPDKPGRFPVILSMTPYGKDHTPPSFKPDGSYLPTTYPNYVSRLYGFGAELGHMKVSMDTAFEAPDPAFWVPSGYVVIIADRRGCFKSEGKPPGGVQEGEDLFHVIEWAVSREWSNGNVGMTGVSALCSNQYYAAGRQPAPPHLKAIIAWEGQSDSYRDFAFWGGIPETNFSKKNKDAIKDMPPDQAARIWADAIDPVSNQKMIEGNPRLELITVPALICASWSDKGLHTRGTFEVFRRISSAAKWLYTHGGKKWERFYGEEDLAYQKKFFDHYLKGMENGWQDTPRVRLEVQETREEYSVRFENEFPLARTQYKKLYLNARDGSLSPEMAKEGKAVYNPTEGGGVSFAMTFDKETEITGYMKVKIWVSAKDANDMDLFVAVKKFNAHGNEVQFYGQNGFRGDMAAKGQMRVSQRELDEGLSTPWQPVQRFKGEKKLTPGEIVPVEIAFLPSSTLFREGESLRLYIQGHHPVRQVLLYYDSLINKGEHAIYTGDKYDSYLQVPVIPQGIVSGRPAARR